MEYYDSKDTLPKGCIRLLTILPKTETEIIRLELEVVNLAEVDGLYDAISYMWGDPNVTRKVWVDGSYVPVRDNIWRFLRHYRHADIESKAVKLWVDSICINQENPVEKNQQVMVMGDIFKNASRVLVWLGNVSEHTDATNDDLDLAQAILEDPWIACPEPPTILGTDQREEKAVNILQTISEDLDSRFSSSAQALLRLGSAVSVHPYWTRLWIVQEIFFARGGPKLIYGEQLLEMDLLDLLVRLAIRSRQAESTCSTPEISLHKRAYEDVRLAMKINAARADAPSLWHLIERYRTHVCQDSRDHIYGLLGLAHPETASAIDIDYEVHPEHLFLKVCTFLRREHPFESHRSARAQEKLQDIIRNLAYILLVPRVIAWRHPIMQFSVAKTSAFLIRDTTSDMRYKRYRLVPRPNLHPWLLTDNDEYLSSNRGMSIEYLRLYVLSDCLPVVLYAQSYQEGIVVAAHGPDCPHFMIVSFPSALGRIFRERLEPTGPKGQVQLGIPFDSIKELGELIDIFKYSPYRKGKAHALLTGLADLQGVSSNDCHSFSNHLQYS